MTSSSGPASVAFFVSPFLAATCSVFASDGECVIVDPGLNVAAAVREYIAAESLTVVGVLVSHGHLDHVADVVELVREFDSPVYVGADDEYRLDNPVDQLPSAFTAQVAPLMQERGWAKPAHTVVLREGDEVAVGATRFVAWAAPGHTEGSTILVCDSEVKTEPAMGVSPRSVRAPGIAFTGDVLFAGTIGRTDLPGGSPEDMKASLSRLRGEAFERPHHLIVPGHGAVSTFGDELANNRFLSL